jgi:hypothetical protein
MIQRKPLKRHQKSKLSTLWDYVQILAYLGFWALVIVLIFAAGLLFDKWYYANIVFASFT